MQELVTSEPSISEEAVQLMKFHGSYMQDDREKRTFGSGKLYQFMMRTKQPGGWVTNRLYKVMDDLADLYGNGSLRLTTRQTFQLHGVLKGDLKSVFSSVIKAMGSTLGACGDVNRNVMAPSAPYKNRPDYDLVTKTAEDIAELLAPQSGAYYDVWLDGERFFSHQRERPEVTEARLHNAHGTNYENCPEPIYGPLFLPRKFKVGVTVPGDNSIDLLTNDLGLVLVSDEAGTPIGWDVYVGGGMGRSHGKASTFARTAEPLGFCSLEDVFHAVKAIVAVQRDYGRRDDRKQSRLKYLVSEWGIDRFRKVTEQYFGKAFEPFVELPPWEFKPYLGWMEQGDGKLAYGVFVSNGRVKGPAKKALRAIIDRYDLPVCITANQNVILCDVDPAIKETVETELAEAGLLPFEQVDPLLSYSMACPAMPLCGLAIGESERVSPEIIKGIRGILDSLGFDKSETFVIRMTGCPNGCARPYMAELGFVGDGANSYQIWLAGSPNQEHIAKPFAERVKVDDFEAFFKPIFKLFKDERTQGESFGDFCTRVGFDKLREAQGPLASAQKKKGPKGRKPPVAV